jgi:hypothetical protein
VTNVGEGVLDSTWVNPSVSTGEVMRVELEDSLDGAMW